MIALSAGHHPGDPGASAIGRTEHYEACRWVATIGEVLEALDQPYLCVPTGPLRSKVDWINARHANVPFKLCIEVHFNSDPNHDGRGSETLYCPASKKGLAAAQIVQGAMGAIMRPNRGIKEGWYKQDKPGHEDYVGDVDGDEKVVLFLKATDPIALILEPEFIHRGDAINRLREPACEIIASALVRAAAVV